jgi:uncharacterized paraquat-inducible protein A
MVPSYNDVFNQIITMLNEMSLVQFAGFSIGVWIMLIIIRTISHAFGEMEEPSSSSWHSGPLMQAPILEFPQVNDDQEFARLEAERKERILRHEKKQVAHKCVYCGQRFTPDRWGNCSRCGAPQD